MKILFVSEKPEDFDKFLTERERLFDEGYELACWSPDMGINASLIVNKILVINPKTYYPDLTVKGTFGKEIVGDCLSLSEWCEVVKSGSAKSTRGKRHVRR
jgi:hypothetical protein